MVFSFFGSGTAKFVYLLVSVAAIKFSIRSRLVNSHVLPSYVPSAPSLLRFVQMTDPVQCYLSILTTSFPSRWWMEAFEYHMSMILEYIIFFPSCFVYLRPLIGRI